MTDIKTITAECELLLKSHITPNYTYKIFTINNIAKNAVTLKNNTLTLHGESITKHLEGCNKAILFGATLGYGVDMLIRKMQVEDMAKAVIIDSLAGVEIERVCDDLEQEIKRKYPDYILTSRFSPGYGDLPLSTQKEFEIVLNLSKTIGVSVNNNMTLSPFKSVTAIIGIKNHA